MLLRKIKGTNHSSASVSAHCSVWLFSTVSRSPEADRQKSTEIILESQTLKEFKKNSVHDPGVNQSALLNILSTKSDSRVGLGVGVGGQITHRRACRPARSSRAGISSCLPQLTPGSARSLFPPRLQPQLQDKTSVNSQTLSAIFIECTWNH